MQKCRIFELLYNFTNMKWKLATYVENRYCMNDLVVFYIFDHVGKIFERYLYEVISEKILDLSFLTI